MTFSVSGRRDDDAQRCTDSTKIDVNVLQLWQRSNRNWFCNQGCEPCERPIFQRFLRSKIISNHEVDPHSSVRLYIYLFFRALLSFIVYIPCPKQGGYGASEYWHLSEATDFIGHQMSRCPPKLARPMFPLISMYLHPLSGVLVFLFFGPQTRFVDDVEISFRLDDRQKGL